MKHFLSYVLLFFLCIAAQAQERTITGVVTASEDKQPLPGVAVTVKGTTTGVITGIDGKFSVKVSDEKSVLIFSYIGYQKQEIVTGTNATFAVELVADFTKLDEVVVVGYGVQKKSLVTGSIAKINSEAIAQSNSLRASQALQGKTAGVVVMNNSGQPGDAVQVTIRGIGTNGNSNPLYVVDGLALPDGSSLDFLNPSDIESMEVLKDAASGAIYGARAANGVVVISTKQGKVGEKFVVTYEGYYGVQNAARKLDVTNSRDYMTLVNEGAANDNMTTLPFSPAMIDSFSKTNTDWQAEMFYKNAPKQSHVLTFQGATEKATYFSSLSYFVQDGIVSKGKSNYERFGYRLNTTREFGVIKLGSNISLSAITSKGISANDYYSGTALVQALNMPNIVPVKFANGNWGTPESLGFGLQEISNPIALTNNLNSITKTKKIVGNLNAELDFGKLNKRLSGLFFRTQYSIEFTNVYNRNYNPAFNLDSNHKNEFNSVSTNMDNYQKNTITNTLNYDKTLGDHHINVVLGQEAFKETHDKLGAGRNTVIFYDLDHAYIDNAKNELSTTASGYYTEHTVSSIFGRLNYDLKSKYMLTGIIRKDGSSRFGSNNKYGVFPSVSGGWVVSKEDFFKTVEPIINSLKVRASWGQNGQEPDDDFKYASMITQSGLNYYFGQPNVQYVGAQPSFYANPNLKWATSEQTNIGIDLAFFQNRITLNVDVYQKDTKGLQLKVPVMLLAGNNGPVSNGSHIQNKGIEIELGYKNSFGNFKLEVTGTGNINKNKVIDISNEEKRMTGGTGGIGQADIIQSRVGAPISEFYGYKTDGLFQNVAQVNAYAKDGVLIQKVAKPGDVKFVDINNDGKIDNLDRVSLGSPFPKFTGGLNIDLKWKGLDFQMFWYTSIGGKVWEASYRYDTQKANFRTKALGRWTGEGTSNDYPRMTLSDANENFKSPSDKNVRNATYTRLKNITLGYTLPKTWAESMKIQKVRFYVTAENLITITPYDGYEPEIGGDLFGRGIDHGNYPQARTVLGGLSITF